MAAKTYVVSHTFSMLQLPEDGRTVASEIVKDIVVDAPASPDAEYGVAAMVCLPATSSLHT